MSYSVHMATQSLKSDLSGAMQVDACVSRPTTNESMSKCAGMYLGPFVAAIVVTCACNRDMVVVDNSANRRHLFLPL